MNKEQLFEKYGIEPNHFTWEPTLDNWPSVEIYRLMHKGELPGRDSTVRWVVGFLDKKDTDMPWFVKNVMSRKDFGSLYLTAKRMVYRFSDQILSELK